MFVVFDLETTGFHESTCDVIEFAYILFDDNNNVVQSEQLYFYYKGMSWGEEAYKVHQIPMSFLEQYEDKFEENLIKMYTVLNRANVAGHNCIRFDCPFVKTWLMRMGIRNLEFGVIQDTMKAFQPVYHAKRIKLTRLCEQQGLTPDGIRMMQNVWFPNADPSRPHEASYDVTATALLVLQGIDKKLIMFEPLNTIDNSVSANDLSAMYEESHITTDPKRFIVELETDSGDHLYHFVNHDYQSHVDVTPTEGDVRSYDTVHKLFPLVLVEDGRETFIARHNGVVYQLEMRRGDRDIFSIMAEWGTMTDEDLDISKVIANTFGSNPAS